MFHNGPHRRKFGRVVVFRSFIAERRMARCLSCCNLLRPCSFRGLDWLLLSWNLFVGWIVYLSRNPLLWFGRHRCSWLNASSGHIRHTLFFVFLPVLSTCRYRRIYICFPLAECEAGRAWNVGARLELRWHKQDGF